jgi:hypothetical protein
MNARELEQDPDIIAENRTLQASTGGCPYGHGSSGATLASSVSASAKPYRFIALKLNGRTFTGCRQTAELLQEIGGVPALLRLTDIFYKKAFADSLLDTFIASHNDPHFKRLGLWIAEKMDPSDDVWTQERRVRNANPCPVILAGGQQHIVHDRSSAHAAAWYSKKRPQHVVGEHFSLHDSRVWMRLMFWSAREAGLLTNPSFAEWYVKFIAHFIRVYEGTAPQFARESLRWSASQSNIDAYLGSRQRRTVGDVTADYHSMPAEVATPGPLSRALATLPPEEHADASAWPYHQRPM